MSRCPTCGHDAAPPAGLTEDERDLMRVIVECFDADGTTPSYVALAKEVGLASASGIHRLVSSLELKGWVKRRGNHRQGLYILHRPPMPDFAVPDFRLAKAG